ncbi:uncharacterized protein [Eurosta solidaginis]|uniref:uncharacterized protein n=1 Tax=Eurosta solidaginis TaxID=178769 RepID=UPI0035306A08
MQKLKAKRSLLKGAVTRILSFISSGGDSPVSDWECRLERLEEVWSEYRDIVRAMVEKSDGEEEPMEEIQADAEEFEERVLTTKGKLRAHITAKSHATGASNESTRGDCSVAEILSSQTEVLGNLAKQVSGPNLSFMPKLKIKSFSGELTEWKSFHDSYVTSIHNNSVYSSCQKFQLLKSYLTEAAYDLIGHIPATNDNYPEAWSKLCARYNKLGVIAHTQISKFLNLTAVSNQSASSLRKLYDGADEVVRGLRALGDQATKRDIWLIHIILGKLDSTTAREWTKLTKSDDDFPTFDEFLTFLDKTCIMLEAVTPATASRTESRTVAVRSHQTTIEKNMKCSKCSDLHELHQCTEFLNMDVKSRREFVTSKRICYNCLRLGHISNNCRSKFSCRNCRKRHHSLLHEEEQQTDKLESFVDSAVSVNFHALPAINTLLPTAVCQVRDSYGCKQKCRLLLDSGSEKTIISESAVSRLGLHRKHARIPVHGLDNSATGISRGWVSLQITSSDNNNTFTVDALIMPTIASFMPANELNKEQYTSFLSLDLADPLFYMPAPIDVLLGNDKFFDILRGEKISVKQQNLCALSTSLGWVVGGDLNKNTSDRSVGVFLSNVDIDQTLTRFWETEEVEYNNKFTDDELKAEQSFSRTYTRSNDGKFNVELPFKTNINNFGNSFECALKRLQATERRLASNPDIKLQYLNFMADYLTLDHMEKVPHEEISKSFNECYYLPHHPVFKTDSTTTKLRVVFDGSARSGSHPSLNDTLLIGPPLLREIFDILLRFRRHRYIMSGDVEKMYRMIWVHDYHRDFQRILWRSSPEQPVDHYRLKTVTYGTACAPFLAVRVLEELAQKNQDMHPLASQTIMQSLVHCHCAFPTGLGWCARCHIVYDLLVAYANKNMKGFCHQMKSNMLQFLSFAQFRKNCSQLTLLP